ncbi:hypothetical protein [uncultured Tateyamaria sp.]|nr:hypothetical protein [uncultured Tateyamaria sp.]
MPERSGARTSVGIWWLGVALFVADDESFIALQARAAVQRG